MPCRCGERRIAISNAVTAARIGDLATARAKAGFVARSMAEDAARSAAARLTAARSRLAGR